MFESLAASGKRFGLDIDIPEALIHKAPQKPMKDFYRVGLWSYCEGEIADGVERITYCSPPSTNFYFDPVDILGLKDSLVQELLKNSLQDLVLAYSRGFRWASSIFIVAAVLTAAEVVLWGLAITVIPVFVAKIAWIVLLAFYHRYNQD